MTRTLATSDYDAARRRAASAVAEIHTYFGEVRQIMAETWMGKPIDEVDADDAVAAAKDKARAIADFENLSMEARHRLEVRIAGILIQEQQYLVEERPIVDGMQSVLRSHRIAKRDQEIAALKYKAEMLESTVKILAGSRPANDAEVHSTRLPRNALKEDALRPWTEFKEAFFEHQSPGTSARSSYNLAFRRLEGVIGQKPIHEITPTDIRSYREAIEKATAPREGRERASAANLQKLLSHIKTFFTWAAGDKGLIKENPAKEVFLTPAQRKESTQNRSPYSLEALDKIFHAPLFTGCSSRARRLEPGTRVIRDSKFWFPLVSLYTGARENELQQLGPADVLVEEGHLCFKITIIPTADDDSYEAIKDEKKKNDVKTKNAPRLIPVHPVLKKLGFVEWVTQRKKERAASIFEEYDYGKFWNQSFLPNIDLKKPGITMYSFRHTYKRALRSFQNNETQNRLMGHAPKHVGELYGGGIDASEAKYFCEFFTVPVDLSHLYPLTLPTK